MDLRVIYCFVQTVFLVTFKSLVIEEVSFTSQIVPDFNMYFDLYKSMSEIDLHDKIH